MKLAIMQPYLFPYIGYFQLMNAVDSFVVYDNIEYTKKGWINRNRILVNGKDEYITFPLKKDSDYLTIKERSLSDSWMDERKKMLNKITECYRKAPFFSGAFNIIQKCILNEERNLFSFILYSLEQVKSYLGITTPIVISSNIRIDHSKRSEAKVLAICHNLAANKYLNPIGGVELYSKETFINNGVELGFLRPGKVEYKQFKTEFVPMLSIIDIMMFNSRDQISQHLSNYTIE